MDVLSNIIAFCGKRGSGKDTAADWFVDRMGYAKVNFADAVYQEVADLHNVTVKHVRSNKALYTAKLQEVGQGYRQQYGQDYWIKRWVQKAEGTHSSIVCADLRYPNEGLYLSLMGAFLVRIEVTEELRRARLAERDGYYNPLLDAHESEYWSDRLPVHLTIPGTLGPEEGTKIILDNLSAQRS